MEPGPCNSLGSTGDESSTIRSLSLCNEPSKSQDSSSLTHTSYHRNTPGAHGASATDSSDAYHPQSASPNSTYKKTNKKQNNVPSANSNSVFLAEEVPECSISVDTQISELKSKAISSDQSDANEETNPSLGEADEAVDTDELRRKNLTIHKLLDLEKKLGAANAPKITPGKNKVLLQVSKKEELNKKFLAELVTGAVYFTSIIFYRDSIAEIQARVKDFFRLNVRISDSSIRYILEKLSRGPLEIFDVGISYEFFKSLAETITASAAPSREVIGDIIDIDKWSQGRYLTLRGKNFLSRITKRNSTKEFLYVGNELTEFYKELTDFEVIAQINFQCCLIKRLKINLDLQNKAFIYAYKAGLYAGAERFEVRKNINAISDIICSPKLWVKFIHSDGTPRTCVTSNTDSSGRKKTLDLDINKEYFSRPVPLFKFENFDWGKSSSAKKIDYTAFPEYLLEAPSQRWVLTFERNEFASDNIFYFKTFYICVHVPSENINERKTKHLLSLSLCFSTVRLMRFMVKYEYSLITPTQTVFIESSKEYLAKTYNGVFNDATLSLSPPNSRGGSLKKHFVNDPCVKFFLLVYCQYSFLIKYIILTSETRLNSASLVQNLKYIIEMLYYYGVDEEVVRNGSNPGIFTL